MSTTIDHFGLAVLQQRDAPMETRHKDYVIVPGARKDALGRWMPIVSVQLQRPKDGIKLLWPPQPFVSERYESRREAEERSVGIAKQMIDRGQFKATEAIRSPMSRKEPPDADGESR